MAADREGSVLTAYTGDDRAVWREFRRELIIEGFSSSLIRRNKALIKSYIKELGSRGLLDENPVADDEAEQSIEEHHADQGRQSHSEGRSDQERQPDEICRSGETPQSDDRDESKSSAKSETSSHVSEPPEEIDYSIDGLALKNSNKKTVTPAKAHSQIKNILFGEVQKPGRSQRTPPPGATSLRPEPTETTPVSKTKSERRPKSLSEQFDREIEQRREERRKRREEQKEVDESIRASRRASRKAMRAKEELMTEMPRSAREVEYPMYSVPKSRGWLKKTLLGEDL